MNLTIRKRDEKGQYVKERIPFRTGLKLALEKKHRAVVKYRRTADGKNKIVALEGFLTSEEIQEIGPEVWRLWDTDDHGMYRTGPGYVFCRGWGNVYVGKIYTDEDFNNLIAEMKACGKALSRIIRDVRAAELAEVRVIEI